MTRHNKPVLTSSSDTFTYWSVDQAGNTETPAKSL